MKRLRRILGTVAYACLAGGPILAATGVGIPLAAVIGGVGVVAGATLHYMDNPRDAKAAAELGTTVKGAIDTVRAVQKSESEREKP